ncbi:MAG: hypothetical protein V3W41_21435 [Planctomycetota bacterium]
MKRLLALLFVFGVTWALPAADESAEAAVIAMTLDDLAQGADAIFAGQIISKSSSWTENGAMINTEFTVQVTSTLKGQLPQQVTVKVPGGDLDGIKIRNAEAPTFELGESVYVFGQHDTATDQYKTYGWFQGKYTVLNGMVRELNGVSVDEFHTQILNAVNN